MPQADSRRLDAPGERGQALDCSSQRRRVHQLRADVAADADHLERGHRRRLCIEPLGVAVSNAKLVLAQAGGDVGMRSSVDVWIDTERHRRASPQLPRHRGHALQLGRGLEVDAIDVLFQRQSDLIRGLADAREQDLARVAAGRQHARQLAARDDVEAGAQARQQGEHRQIRIRLDRVAQHRVAPVQRLREFPVRALDRRAGIDVAGRAEAPRNVFERHLLGAQRAVAVSERHVVASFVQCRRRADRVSAWPARALPA